MILTKNSFAAAAIAAVFCLPAISQAGILDGSQIVAQSTDPAVGVPGARLDDDTSTFNQVLIDDNCRLYYVAEMDNGFGPAIQNRDLGLWSATNSSNVALQVVENIAGVGGLDMVPGVPNAVFGRVSASSGNPLNGLPSSGYMTTGGTNFLFGAGFSDDGSGASGVTPNVNDTAVFIGDSVSGYSITPIRRGGAAPGIAGASFNETYSSLSTQRTSLNGAGNWVHLANSLAGVTTGVDDEAALWGHSPSTCIAARKGDLIGTAGHTLFDLRFDAKINSNGDVLFDPEISGGDVTGPTDNNTIFMNTGTGNVMIWREGTMAPGTGGMFFQGTPPSLSSNSFTTAGVNFVTLLSPTQGGASTIQGLFVANTTSTTNLVLQGDATGLAGDVNFGVFNNTSVSFTNSGRSFFHNTMAGGDVTTDNDSSRWTIAAGGTPELIAREGDAAPGTAGAMFGSLATGNVPVNDLDQALFTFSLAGGDVIGTTNDSALYLWDTSMGLTQLLREGDTILTPLGSRDVSSWSISQFDNGDGSAVSFNDSGFAAIEVSFTSGSGGGQAIFRVLVPEPTSGSILLMLMGLGGVLRRRV